MLVRPFPWETKHTHIFQKPKQTKIKGSLKAQINPDTLHNPFQKQLMSPGDAKGVMLQMHAALWSVLNAQKQHPSSPLPGASSGVDHPACFPSWMEDAIWDQAGDTGIQELQGEQNKPHLW